VKREEKNHRSVKQNPCSPGKRSYGAAGIKHSEAMKRVLKDEVREKSTKKILGEASKASEILKKVREDDWTDSVRKSRDER